MAISKMNKLTLLTPEHLVDDLLMELQGLQQVEIINLDNQDPWDSLEESTDELLDEYEKQSSVNTSKEALEDLDDRLHNIERAIELADRFVEKPSFIQTFKDGKREVSFNHIQLHGEQFDEKEIVSQTIQLVERLDELEVILEDTRDKVNDLERWKNLEITPNKLNCFSYVNGVVGRVPSTNEDSFINYLRENENYFFEVVFIDENDYGVVVFSYSKENSQILNDLKTYQFLPFKYTSDKLPKNQLDEWNQTIKDAKYERSEIVETLKTYQSTLDELKIQYEYVNNLSAREQVKYALKKADHLVVINGWIEADNTTHFLQTIQDRFEQLVVAKIQPLDQNDYDTVPTKLKNKGIFKPYEMITTMYGLPNYKEVDPTPFVMPFYWLFFGMMIADLGYGLLISAVSLVPLLLFKVTDSVKNILNLTLSLGISVMVWGIIYGSFFGFTVEWMQLIDLQSSVMEVMILSLAIGIIHMGIAFGINTYLQIKDKNYAKAYSDGIHWIVVLIGIVLVALSFFIPNMDALMTVGVGMIIISFIGMMVANVIEAGSISGLGTSLLGLLNAVSYFGDIISYSRLMALGLSGISIGAAFNIIVGQIPFIGRITIGLVIFAFLHIFNMSLSLLTGGVHSLRLIFVEFFGKFYIGNGRPFKPLRINEKYVSITKNQKVGE